MKLIVIPFLRNVILLWITSRYIYDLLAESLVINTYRIWIRFPFIYFISFLWFLVHLFFEIRYFFSSKWKYSKKLFFFFSIFKGSQPPVFDEGPLWNMDTQLNWIFAESDAIIIVYVSFLKWKFYFLHTNFYECSPLLRIFRTTSTRETNATWIFFLLLFSAIIMTLSLE